MLLLLSHAAALFGPVAAFVTSFLADSFLAHLSL